MWFPGWTALRLLVLVSLFKNSWGNKDRDAIYLKYTVDFSNGLKLETEDTLVAHSRGVAREDFTPIYVKN